MDGERPSMSRFSLSVLLLMSDVARAASPFHWLDDIGAEEPRIPRKIWQTDKACENSQARGRQGFSYECMDDTAMLEYMRTHATATEFEVFKCLPLVVMKADMWRYLVLYHEGGVYADSDVRFHKRPASRVLRNWMPPNASAILLREGERKDGHCRSFVAQNFLAAEPKHPVFKKALDLLVARVLQDGGVLPSKQSEHFVHYYSGPAMFTTAVEDVFGKLPPTPETLQQIPDPRRDNGPTYMQCLGSWERDYALQGEGGTSEGGWKKKAHAQTDHKCPELEQL